MNNEAHTMPIPEGLAMMPYYNTTADMMKAELQALMPALDLIRKDTPFTYPEARFRQYFAPFFLGLYEVPKEYSLLNLWVSEVGGYHVEVNIVDPMGNTLFVVPAMLNTNANNINVNGFHRYRFSNLEAEYQMDSMNNPQGASVDYHNGIGHKLGSLFQGYSADPTHLDKWLKIFAYYNVVPPAPENVTIRPNTGEQPVRPIDNSGWANVGQLDFNPTFD